MKISDIGTIISRAIGSILMLSGILMAINFMLSYFRLTARLDNYHDVYFAITDTAIFYISITVVGLLLIVFSKKVGQLLARGLE